MKKHTKTLLFPLIFLLSACNSYPGTYTDERPYSEFARYDIQDIENFYSYEGKYYLYIYSDACMYCVNIKGNVFTYIEKYENGEKEHPLYMFNIKAKSTEEGSKNRGKFKERPNEITEWHIEQYRREMIETGASSLSETYFIGTPSLYVIENHKLVDFIIDSNDVAYYLY